MTNEQQTDAAKVFANKWNGRGNEISDYQEFWWTMLRDVFGVDKPEEITKQQESVRCDGKNKRIDILIPRTKVLIEQKSADVDLNKSEKQSDGESLTPYEQAQRYADALPDDKKPRYIITCNFDEFHIYDIQQMDLPEYIMQTQIYKPTVIKLENFRNDFKYLSFIVDPNVKIQPEIKISIDAAKIVRNICRTIDKKYTEQDNAYIDNLSKLCARLVFCFYADDSQLFTHSKFADYLKGFNPAQLQDALQNFFDALNTPENQRDTLKAFPYVDGGLFEEKISIPPLNDRFKHELEYAHIFRTDAGNFRLDELNNFIKFSWREINPTIFGAMFESVFNNDTRHEDGIYYTSIENIHKVIDPLFMDDLYAEFELVRRKHIKNRPQALRDLQNKIASLNFLDPACGSGNFLTETYLSLRTLENKILAELRSIYADTPEDSIKVSPRQFYGIEINSFAVAIAKVALSIAENQMRRKSNWILGRDAHELPLTKYVSIRRANANQIDWAEVVAPPNVNYIIGNPPFRGRRHRTIQQHEEVAKFFDYRDVDYVACWYKKAMKFIRGTSTRVAFVSTNSVCQGEQVAPVWEEAFAEGVHIDFAHRTFKWLSDSENVAHVHCVIVGFSSAPNPKPKIIFDGDKVTITENINAYLLDAPNIFIKNQRHPVCDVIEMRNGNVPLDGDALKIEAEDYEMFIRYEPAAKKFIKRLIGGRELIYNELRYVLWLVGLPMSEIKKMPFCHACVELCRQRRLAMHDKSSLKLSERPTTFRDTFNPENYIALPMVSSENRRYVPMAYFDGNIIPTNQVQIIPDATLYHFGILTSSIHMAWLRTVGGRFKSDYRYSKEIVYNNFVWCRPTPEQKALIEESAQRILDVRKRYPDWTYAALYNEDTMPDDLRSAHKWNDYNVALAYRFEKFLDDEARIVAELMKLYKALTS